MTDKVQKIREEVERRIIFQKECIKNSYRLTGKPEEEIILEYKQLLSFIDSLQEESVSEDLEEEANRLFDDCKARKGAFELGAIWQKEHLWKSADGDDLPEIDREVIALLNNGKVVFAHRPYKGKYIGKNLTTGNIETFENKTYDKGGWNQPDVKWWLDIELPKEK